ncbi:transcriptional regulator [Candidatus Thorarchaeota archaeon]|nr:MAG: transcriptional regulator [Candidatus Thorarchaeota archaeon]
MFPDLAAQIDSIGGIIGILLHPSPDFLVQLPIYLGVVLIMVIAMWIGYTMVTTPAPEPLEDFDFDEEEVTEKKEE